MFVYLNEYCTSKAYFLVYQLVAQICGVIFMKVTKPFVLPRKTCLELLMMLFDSHELSESRHHHLGAFHHTCDYLLAGNGYKDHVPSRAWAFESVSQYNYGNSPKAPHV